MNEVTTRLKPLEDRVLILPDKAPAKTESGLYIPDTVQDKLQPARGTVVAVGPGRELGGNAILYKIYKLLCTVFRKDMEMKSIMPLKVGDRVMYGHYSGTMVEDPEAKKEFLIMRLDDIFIIIP